MIRMAEIVKLFEADFLRQYGDKLLPRQRKPQCGGCYQLSLLPQSSLSQRVLNVPIDEFMVCALSP